MQLAELFFTKCLINPIRIRFVSENISMMANIGPLVCYFAHRFRRKSFASPADDEITRTGL